MTRPTSVTVAVDAMGGDFAPQAIVQGALDGSRRFGCTVLLVGPQAVVEAELATANTQGAHYQVVDAPDIIGMGDSPATAIRRKKNASIVVTAKLVKEGRAQAMVAAGSTGAAMAAALLYIGRIPGVDRPAIGVVLPSTGAPTLLLDAGANADCIPEMLLQFGQMGSVFMHNVYGVAQPRVGILNIGEELGKGNAMVNAAFELLSHDAQLHFVGNVEGNDLFKGTCDVAVCDGFVGNVALKSAEGIAKMLMSTLKEELTGDLKSKAGALLAKSALKRVKAKVDPHEYGGALLLGINGICVIGHGSSNAYAVENAVRVAVQAVESNVLAKMSAATHSGGEANGGEKAELVGESPIVSL
ncbi:MAG: phosphate acyltransferase PlsX [Vampirovibrionales bacterium]